MERQAREILVERIARRCEATMPDVHSLIVLPDEGSGWSQILFLDGARNDVAVGKSLAMLKAELADDLRLLRRVADEQLELSIDERRLTNSEGKVLAFSGGAWRPAA